MNKELSVWDYLDQMYFQKTNKLDIKKVHEVSNRKDLIDKKVKKNKERIYIPNATIEYYNYRYEQDTGHIQDEDESEALKTGQKTTSRRKEHTEKYNEGIEEITI